MRGAISTGIRARGAGAFAPPALFAGGATGAWWDVSDIGTLFQDTARTVPVTASGQAVARVDDKSGNGNHLLQTTVTRRPIYTETGGLKFLQFDGADDCLQAASVTLPAYASYFLATRMGVQGMLLEHSADATVIGTKGMYLYGPSAGLRIAVTRGLGGAGAGSGGWAAAAANNWMSTDDAIVELQFNASVRQHFNNGIAQSLGAVTNNFSVVENATAALNLFARNGGAALPSSGRFYGGIIAADPAGALPYDAIRNWLAIRQGRTYPVALSRLIVLGDSTVAAYAGTNAVTDYLSVPRLTVNNLAVPGHTITQQQTVWSAFEAKDQARAVIVQVGLNDLDPAETAAAAIARLQGLVDTVRSRILSGAAILAATMTPCRQRLIDVYGAVNGPVSYQKWLDINTALSGGGATPITGVDGRITAHTAALNDGSGNLAAAYNTGDNIHENNAGRRIVGNAYAPALIAVGVTATAL